MRRIDRLLLVVFFLLTAALLEPLTARAQSSAVDTVRVGDAVVDELAPRITTSLMMSRSPVSEKCSAVPTIVRR